MKAAPGDRSRFLFHHFEKGLPMTTCDRDPGRLTRLASRLDIVATSAGIAHIRLGRGRVEAASRQARAWVERAREELAEYLGGRRSSFTVPVDLSRLSEFQRAVLAAAQEIPFGEVRPYRWVAELIGRPRAVRAVGTALGDNPVPILIPCHRVIRSDGTSLGGYMFGLSIKDQLLALERKTMNDQTRGRTSRAKVS